MNRIAVVGATGAVGREFLRVMDLYQMPLAELRLLASPRSAGTTMSFRGQELPVEVTTADSFKGIDIALFSAGSSISRQYADAVRNAGAVLIDNSSAFRMQADVPLVVPEINPEDAQKHNGIIANPNCSTIIMLMAVYPLHRKYPVSRIIASTYQAASGAGWEAMEELRESTRAALEGREYQPKVLPHPYAFNLFSHNAAVGPDGYNEEETKMIREARKILHAESLAVTATCVRVPVLRAHCESINIEFAGKAPSEAEARELLAGFPGVRLVDDRQRNHFPMPIEASEQPDVLVGRIRKDVSRPDTNLELFVAGDQLLKGAAQNAVQIAMLL